VDGCLSQHGRVDLFYANAGVIAGAGLGEEGGGPFAALEDFARSFDVNVMGQVHAARAVLPSMLARGEGYIVNTASAAGLLTDLGALAYALSKHASVGLSEWLAIAYGARGIRVSCLCPMGVRTPMLDAAAVRGEARHLLPDALEPAAVAASVVEGLRDERFLILPHPEVLAYFQRKAADYDRWLDGMRRLRSRLYPDAGA
jgi:NAD(P)-dependent dehydrogenase (short-subunit alcohol dehydrogenase family)